MMELRKAYSIAFIVIVCSLGFILCGNGKANATAFSGSLPPPAEANAYLRIDGSFGNQSLRSYGKLDLLIDIYPDTAIYKEIIFKTLPETYEFSGEFESGFNGELIPVVLELTYEMTYRTNQSSQELAITPKQGGGYNIESFHTSDCDFRCYDFIITGTWTAIGPTETISGDFSHLIDGRNIRGIGSTTTSDLDPTGYPTTSALVNFRWDSSTSGVPIPRIVEVTVDGALVIIDVSIIGAGAHMGQPVIPSLSLEPKIPAAIFNASQVTGDAPLSVNFFDESVGEIDTWEWEFGDGLESPYQNPTHTYTRAGTYTVTLTITGLDGTDTKTRTNYITVNEPPEPPPPPPDTDGDRVIDPEDNCINEYNPAQEDSDLDKIGDACDIDLMQLQIDDMSSDVDSLVEQNETLQTQMTRLIEAYKDMNQRIQELEQGYSDHNHSYLTGKGKGHNDRRAVSGPAIYPASP